jgi:hypothetical protein
MEEEKQDIFMQWIYECEDPKEIFAMVMEYAKRTKKSSWKCMGEVFNGENYSAVMRDVFTGEYKGYLNGWINHDGDIFLNHAYLRCEVEYKKGLIYDFHKMVEIKEERPIDKITFITAIPAKLWKRYGFEPSKNTLFERRIK